MADPNEAPLGGKAARRPPEPPDAGTPPAAASQPSAGVTSMPVPSAPSGWVEILVTKEVPRAGGSYLLREGDVINTSSYDMKAVQRAGVKFQPAEAPEWWLQQQAEAGAKRAMLDKAAAARR
jgi:hypothetical protein